MTPRKRTILGDLVAVRMMIVLIVAFLALPWMLFAAVPAYALDENPPPVVVDDQEPAPSSVPRSLAISAGAAATAGAAYAAGHRRGAARACDDYTHIKETQR